MAENESDVVETEEEESSPKGKKGLILIILLLLLGGAGAGLYFTGMLDSILGETTPEETVEEVAEGEPAAKEGEEAGAAVYYELPHIMANLNPGGAAPSFIKMTINLEAPSEEVVTRLQAIQPKLMDIINTYVRELRPSDLNGSAGIYRLRDELLLRVNKAIYPDKVNNILFKDILIQE